MTTFWCWGSVGRLLFCCSRASYSTAVGCPWICWVSSPSGWLSLWALGVPMRVNLARWWMRPSAPFNSGCGGPFGASCPLCLWAACLLRCGASGRAGIWWPEEEPAALAPSAGLPMGGPMALTVSFTVPKGRPAATPSSTSSLRRGAVSWPGNRGPAGLAPPPLDPPSSLGAWPRPVAGPPEGRGVPARSGLAGRAVRPDLTRHSLAWCTTAGRVSLWPSLATPVATESGGVRKAPRWRGTPSRGGRPSSPASGSRGPGQGPAAGQCCPG